MYLWNNPSDPFVPPTWPKNDLVAIRHKISSLLPQGHTIAYLNEHEQPQYNITRSLTGTLWSNMPNMWLTQYGLYQVTQIREAYEQQHGVYDLVIRARGDVGILHPLDCRHMRKFLDQYPRTILTPANHRLGLISPPTNDLFAVGSSPIMSIYCRMFERMFEYHDQGVPYHPETLLSHHLTINDIGQPTTDFRQSFRELLTEQGQTDWGRWL